MKKLLSCIVALSLLLGSASAVDIPPEKNFVFSFNAVADTLGAKSLDVKNIVVTDAGIGYPCEGYDVIIFLNEDGKIKEAGIRLYDDAASGDFLMACMSMIYLLGDMDYEAFGMMLYQYGQVRAGNEARLPWIIGQDFFNMSKVNDDHIVIFSFLNNDLETTF